MIYIYTHAYEHPALGLQLNKQLTDGERHPFQTIWRSLEGPGMCVHIYVYIYMD